MNIQKHCCQWLAITYTHPHVYVASCLGNLILQCLDRFLVWSLLGKVTCWGNLDTAWTGFLLDAAWAGGNLDAAWTGFLCE